MEPLEAPTKRARYGTNYVPSYPYNSLTQTYPNRVVASATTSLPTTDDSDLGSCASAIRSALDLFGDEASPDNVTFDMITPVTWRTNYEMTATTMSGMNSKFYSGKDGIGFCTTRIYSSGRGDDVMYYKI